MSPDVLGQPGHRPAGLPEAEPEAVLRRTEKPRFAEGCKLAAAAIGQNLGGFGELRIPVKAAAYFHDSGL